MPSGQDDSAMIYLGLGRCGVLGRSQTRALNERSTTGRAPIS
jgi:hypothetical protein